MASIDIAFSRALLAQIIPDLKAAGYRVTKDGWVWCAGRDHWEFHGPDGFYWHGNAGNAYEARYHGWSEYLEHKQRPIRGA
jgi:hypothetical protein